MRRRFEGRWPLLWMNLIWRGGWAWFCEGGGAASAGLWSSEGPVAMIFPWR
jgi:hypothetical protein